MKKIKEKTPKLDRKDWLILYELDKDSRQHYSSIAKKLKMSKDVIIYRIKKLSDAGIIRSFISLIDLSKLGYLNFRVYVKLQDLPEEIKQHMIDYLVNNEFIWFVGGIEGKWDFDFIIWVNSIYEFEEFWEEYMNKYRRYVQTSFITFHTRVYNCSRAFFASKKVNDTETRPLGGPEIVKVDELDLKILKVLSQNSRASLVEIANKLHVSAKIVNYRIKRLTRNKVILGYRVLLKLRHMNFEYYKLNIYLNDLSIKKQMMNYALKHPNTLYVDEAIGGWDVEFEVQVRGYSEFRKIVKDIQNKFGKYIRNYEYFLFHEVYKTDYMPLKVKI